MNPAAVRAGAGLLAWALAAAPALATPATADLLQLKDGRVIDGVKMAKEADAVVLHYKNGDIRVPLSLVEDFVIAGAPLPEPANEEEKAKRAQGLVPWKKKWVPVATREKEQKKEAEDRAKAIEEYRKHKEWMNRYLFKTPHFEFESTQPKSQNDDFSELLETYFKEFSKVWKVSVPPKWGRLKVCFYGGRADFQRTAGAPSNVLAYYRFVEPRELNFYYDRDDPALCVACLFHEANHYLTALMNEKFNYPHWVNEAMAEYYGATLWDPATKGLKIGGIQQGRLAEVKVDIAAAKYLSLKDLISSTTDAYEHYYWGWSFVHFMMETPKYRPKFIRFFVDLAQAKEVERRSMGMAGLTVVKDGQEILRTFLSRMGLKEQDLDGLQKEWYAHIDAMDASALAGLEEGGLKAWQARYWRFRAPRLLKEAIDKGSRKPSVWTIYSWCLMLKGGDALKAEAIQTMARATELMPMDSSTWAVRGYVTYAAGITDETQKAAGQKFVDLAREMDPEADFDDPENWIKIREVKDSGE